MDRNGHIIMPGMRGVTPDPSNPNYNYLYRANALFHNQQQTIKNIWNGVYPSPQNWVRKDFSDNFVSNSPEPGIANKNLIFVGNNRMYYIGTDNRIHGYIKYGDVWSTVSPSYAAGNVSSQQLVAGDLVANPSGTCLYYRGINGLFYRYIINNDWSYTYSAMPTNSAMQQQNISAVGSLICPFDNRLYYIANESSNGNVKRIHGFIKYGSSWLTTSPTHAAGNASSQQQAAGDLIANPSGTFLYYRGTNGLFYRYEINSDWSYTYSAMPTNSSMQQQYLQAYKELICPTDNRLYYIAYEKSNGWKKRIHGFIKNGSSWTTVSPSWSAHSNGQNINFQQVANNKLVCSPDNQTISYLGTDNELHGFEINNDWNYSYFNFSDTPSNKKARESLTFNQDNKLFYIASISGDNKVHCFEFGDDHCENQAVQDIEPNCCMYLVDNQDDGIYLHQDAKLEIRISDDESHINNELDIKIYPNPSNKSNVNLLINGLEYDKKVYVIITDLQGKVFLNTIERLNQSSIKINTQNFPNGFYIVQVKSNDQIKTSKLIITK